MARPRNAPPDLADSGFTFLSAKLLSRETIGLGELALQVCEELAAGAAAIVRDNRQLIQANKRIRKKLDGNKAPREALQKTGCSKAAAK